MSDETEIERLRGWLEFQRDFFRYALPGVSRQADAALRGEPAPEYRLHRSTAEQHSQHALGGVDGFVTHLFGSDWHKDIKRVDAVKALHDYLGI